MYFSKNLYLDFHIQPIIMNYTINAFKLFKQVLSFLLEIQTWSSLLWNIKHSPLTNYGFSNFNFVQALTAEIRINCLCLM